MTVCQSISGLSVQTDKTTPSHLHTRASNTTDLHVFTLCEKKNNKTEDKKETQTVTGRKCRTPHDKGPRRQTETQDHPIFKILPTNRHRQSKNNFYLLYTDWKKLTVFENIFIMIVVHSHSHCKTKCQSFVNSPVQI